MQNPLDVLSTVRISNPEESRCSHVQELLEKLHTQVDLVDTCRDLYSHCEKDVAICEFIVEKDGIELLATVLSKYHYNESITKDICSILIAIFRHVNVSTDEYHSIFDTAGGWNALTQVLNLHTRKTDIIDLACNIVNIACNSLFDDMHFRENEGHKLLLGLLSVHKYNERMAMIVMSALQAACKTLPSCERFGECFGMYYLLDVIAIHADSAVVMQAACDLMSTACDVVMSQAIFEQTSCRILLQDALRRHAASPLTVDAICRALFRPLCVDNLDGLECYDGLGSAALSCIAMSLPN